MAPAVVHSAVCGIAPHSLPARGSLSTLSGRRSLYTFLGTPRRRGGVGLAEMASSGRPARQEAARALLCGLLPCLAGNCRRAAGVGPHSSADPEPLHRDGSVALRFAAFRLERRPLRGAVGIWAARQGSGPGQCRSARAAAPTGRLPSRFLWLESSPATPPFGGFSPAYFHLILRKPFSGLSGTGGGSLRQSPALGGIR